VLDHDPTRKDVEAFFGRFQAALKARGLALKGITTDGSASYPEPIATVFGEVPHQLGRFHVLKEVTQAVLGAVAQLRQRLAADAPKLPRGRPASKAARRAARRKKRIEREVGDLFEHRYLFVRRHLRASERETLTRITRGQPQLRRLRGLMEEVYRSSSTPRYSIFSISKDLAHQSDGVALCAASSPGVVGEPCWTVGGNATPTAWNTLPHVP
jgi:hypothetical protein